jgi:Fe-S-cluster-containing dehydrogenase component
MKKYCFVIDVAKCENCNNCFLSCKDEHCGNEWPGYTKSQPFHGQRWMNILRKERGQFPFIDVAYLPKPCMHCDDAPCIAAAEKDAVYKREDGIVIIDPQKAKGQKQIVAACPFGAVWWNEEQQVAQKCTFCAHLLDKGWQKPRCVQACPTGALSILHVEEAVLEASIKTGALEPLDSKGTTARPRCYYKNLYRFEKCVITGSLASGKDGVSDCVLGATVRLFKNGTLVGEQLSDDFGDFVFDGLTAGSGEYEIEIIFAGKLLKKKLINLKESLSVGTLWLELEVP